MADKLKMKVFEGTRHAEKVMALEGILTSDTAFRFRDFVREHESDILVVDMSGVSYVDSSGLGVLIALYVSLERKSGRLLLAGLTDRVWDLFRMCKIEDVFTRFPSVADAEEAIPMPAEGVASGPPPAAGA